MSDDLRDKFGSDDEYEEFKNSYDDYKNKSGMFDESKSQQEYIKFVIKLEELIYKNFVIGQNKFFRVPDEFFNIKYVSLYLFYLNKVEGFQETLPLYMN